MHIRKFKDVKPFAGRDKTEIRQYFQPDNTNKEIRYSLAHFTLGPSNRSAKHKINSSEVYFILEGRGEIVIDGDVFEVDAGDAVFIPPQRIQFIKNIGDMDLKFLCIVDPAWRQEDEIILEDD
ncbi:MAG: cupin domain-containing protein [Nitrosopumilaceae archaeon]|nr:cupin domain-containing protein [Nitrosopumilaceae archaeon]NIU00622.1 cupin domain-containing protein [Nitrosopumilaceae archaeon]NIU87008.1 cupin domain-containing protein [Nitrosopumilaceae archaeon]NIV66472.1 cupin domain-containing protein [Nitrosopumilaceae archaeon]NIX61224.1 cupin domain-containing protein [Nitrosopumilaceae archaeon]